MAVELTNRKYSMSIVTSDDDNKKTTKTISAINFNATGAGGGSSALGADADTILELGTIINESLIGGTYEVTKLVDEAEVIDVG